ncbi:MAG TPA: NAD-dependent epimerase/dehydratase family protein, partial [Methylobacter sp.]
SWLVGSFDDKTLQKKALSGVDVAFHLISSTVPGDDTVDSIKELSDNIFSTLAFLDMCRSCHVKRVVFVSSSSVYGLQVETPIPESALTNPISSHGIQKLTIEKYLLLHQFLYGIDVRIVRLSNPYGPGQNLFGRQGFIALAIGHLTKNEPILLRDSGRPIRDFIYIDDVSRALALAGIAEHAPSILNIGSGIGYSIRQVVDLLEDLIGKTVATVSGEMRKVDIPISVLDVSMASDSLGFEPMSSLREGMIKTLQNHKIPVLSAEGEEWS